MTTQIEWQPNGTRAREQRATVAGTDVWLVERPPYRWQGPGADTTRLVAYIWDDESSPQTFEGWSVAALETELLAALGVTA